MTKLIPEHVKFYVVGGYVRDLIMGRKSKDVDFAVTAPSFAVMSNAILGRGGKVYITNQEYTTIRARMYWEPAGCEVDADFVLCRKDGHYSDGRRPDTVELGTLEDDLARRDLTCNAIAMTEDGTFIDPFGGQKDIRAGLLRAVGVASERFREDSLRLLRAVRFSVTHGLALTKPIIQCLYNPELIDLLDNVSQERIKDELAKMLYADTLQTLKHLQNFLLLRDKIFSGRVWLMPTMKERKNDRVN